MRKLLISAVMTVLCMALFAYPASVGTFRQTKTFSDSPRKLVSSGTVEIVQGKGIVWYMDKPYKSVLAVGKESLFQQVRDSEPVRTDARGNSVYLSIARCMDLLFSGQKDSLEELFELTYQEDDGKWFLLLIPKDKNVASFVSQITVTGSETIESLKLNENTGDCILYEFEGLHKKELTDEELSVFEI